MKNLFETAAIPAFIAVMIMMYFVVGVGVNTSQAQSVMDEWSGVKIPPPTRVEAGQYQTGDNCSAIAGFQFTDMQYEKPTTLYRINSGGKETPC